MRSGTHFRLHVISGYVFQHVYDPGCNKFLFVLFLEREAGVSPCIYEIHICGGPACIAGHAVRRFANLNYLFSFSASIRFETVRPTGMCCWIYPSNHAHKSFALPLNDKKYPAKMTIWRWEKLYGHLHCRLYNLSLCLHRSQKSKRPHMVCFRNNQNYKDQAMRTKRSPVTG